MKRLVVAALLLMTAPALAGPYEDAALKLFAERGLEGGIALSDVRSGRLIFSVDIGDWKVYSPLSTTKLLLAAAAWDRRLKTRIDIDAMLAHSQDDEGRQVALALRRQFGSTATLKDFARFGFPPCRTPPRVNCFILSAKTSDAEWADALSLGERNLVTLAQLLEFLRAIGNDGATSHGRIVHPLVARKLQVALRRTVSEGTARGVADVLPLPWRLGGKTGSGPANAKKPDGIFAGLVFDAHGRARYAVACYVREGGLGGGAATEISAAMARMVIETEHG